MGPPGAGLAPPGLGPHYCRGPGDSIPQETRDPLPEAWEACQRFSWPWCHQLTLLDHWDRWSQFRQSLGRHRPSQRGRTPGDLWGARDGRGTRPPGGAHSTPARWSWWAPAQARHTLGGQAAARGTRASRPEAHHEPGRVGGC
jgi:hypothetical protein